MQHCRFRLAYYITSARIIFERGVLDYNIIDNVRLIAQKFALTKLNNSLSLPLIIITDPVSAIFSLKRQKEMVTFVNKLYLTEM